MDRATDNRIGVHGHPGYALLSAMKSETRRSSSLTNTRILTIRSTISMDLVHSMAAAEVISMHSRANVLMNAAGMATAAMTTMTNAPQTILKATMTMTTTTISTIRRHQLQMLHLHSTLMIMRVTSAIACMAITRPILLLGAALKSLASMCAMRNQQETLLEVGFISALPYKQRKARRTTTVIALKCSYAWEGQKSCQDIP